MEAQAEPELAWPEHELPQLKSMSPGALLGEYSNLRGDDYGTMTALGGDVSQGSKAFIGMFKTLSENTDVLGIQLLHLSSTPETTSLAVCLSRAADASRQVWRGGIQKRQQCCAVLVATL